MIDLKHCSTCGYRHGSGRCCIDVYQQLGQAKGPSVVGKVLLAFLLPLLLFIGSVVLAERLLSGVMPQGGLKTIVAFLAALLVTLVCVQLIRVFTRKPIEMENNPDRKN